MSSTFVVLLFDLMALLPLRVLHFVGAMLGWATYFLSRKYAARMRENLALFGKGQAASDLRKVD